MKQLFTAKFLLYVVFLLPMYSASFAQATVTGKVISGEDSEPLPGVNVSLKGTTTGTVTDIEGNYSIDVPSSGSTLIFSSVGFVSEEIVVGARSVINLSLMPDITSLSEVVVVGYGTTLKQDVTTSISQVDPKGISKAANSGISDLLVGKAAGVEVQQVSAQPGGRVNLSIRGRGNPLVVVDGVIVPTNALEAGVNHSEIDNVNRGNLGGVNPNDIESFAKALEWGLFVSGRLS